MVNSYKDLHVWQRGIDLCKDIYLVTKMFPKTEIYGLTSQIRRCSVSIPSNIAEGNARAHTLEYKQFLRISFGSTAELETQLLLSYQIGYLKQEQLENFSVQLAIIRKMLIKLIKSL